MCKCVLRQILVVECKKDTADPGREGIMGDETREVV